MSVTQSVAASPVSLRLVRESRNTVSAEWTAESASRKPDHFSRDLLAEIERRGAARSLPALAERDLRKAQGIALRGWKAEAAAGLAEADSRFRESVKWADECFALLMALPKGALETPIRPASNGRAAFTLRDAAGMLYTLPTLSEVRKGAKGE